VPEASGWLTCEGCDRRFDVREGVPRFADDSTRSAAHFGYTWGLHAGTVEPPAGTEPWHLHAMQKKLGAPPFSGLILDAGCGDGTDLAMLALAPVCEVVGVELSSGGVATSVARTRGIPRAHVVQGDLLHLPLESSAFDGAYSYGVLHHTPDPARSVREIARTLKPGASLLFYIYEDFSDRPWYWRAALRAANATRVVTTRLPAPILMALCRVLSPVVYVMCTIPSRRFRWAARFPYRHSARPWDLSADLFDRAAPPIERRYSKETAAALATQAGFDVVRVAQSRGWMVWARRPVRQ
jgi:SAM-dependent methyltransferase